jgi:hypothetical protein
MDRVSYSMFPGWKWFLLLVFTGLVAVGLVFFRDAGDPAVWSTFLPWPFSLGTWLLIVVWNAYWLLFRVSYRVELDGRRLRWSTPLRQGEFAVGDLTSISSPIYSSQLAFFRRRSGPSVMVLLHSGLLDFAEEVQKQAPDVEVNLIVLSSLRTGSERGFRREE